MDVYEVNEKKEINQIRLRIQWAKDDKFNILSTDGTHLATLDRKAMMPLFLSESARADFLDKHGVARN